jgi:hypothetical protein
VGISEAISADGVEAQTRLLPNGALYGIYGAAMAVSIAVWLIALRSPLFLDETCAYWQINGGFSGIWARQWLFFPAYSYILWLGTKVLGTSEVALRIPSLLAMLGAVYLLYRAARELFDRETALIAAVLFCVHPIIIFAAVNARPYAFAALAINAAIFVGLRLRGSDSKGLAALFGILAAFIVYFQFLYVTILPALLLCFFIARTGERKTQWRQFWIALAAFAVAFLPVIPGLRFLLRTRGTHVYEAAPKMSQLLWTIAPGWLPVLFLGTALIAFMVFAVKPGRRGAAEHFERWQIVACAALALVPLLTLYGVSAGTSIHTFADIHRTVAVPGIALCWAIVMSRFRPALRLLFCVALVAVTAIVFFRDPGSRQPEYTWKYAVQVVERNASVDNAPVVVCSNFPEADYTAMPANPKDSNLFAQLSYYKLTVPVVPLPRTMHSAATELGSRFLEEAAQKHERFLAMGDPPSYKILAWLASSASGRFDVRKLGVFDQTEVLEFDPRVKAGGVK